MPKLPAASECPGCQTEVYLLKSDSGRDVYVRLMGDGLTVGAGGQVIRVPVLAYHQCALLDRALQENWAARDADNRRQMEEQRAMFGRRDERARAWLTKEAQAFDCPKCGVAAGKPCENLTERAKGKTRPTRWPHPQRADLIESRAERELEARAEIAAIEQVAVNSKIYEAALKFECPACGAKKGKPCENLRERAEGASVPMPTYMPHFQRQVLGEDSLLPKA